MLSPQLRFLRLPLGLHTSAVHRRCSSDLQERGAVEQLLHEFNDHLQGGSCPPLIEVVKLLMQIVELMLQTCRDSYCQDRECCIVSFKRRHMAVEELARGIAKELERRKRERRRIRWNKIHKHLAWLGAIASIIALALAVRLYLAA